MNLKISGKAHFESRIVFDVKDQKGLPADFKGDKGEITVRYEGDLTVIHCGLGETRDLSADRLRAASAAGIRRAGELKRKKVSILEPASDVAAGFAGESCIEGAVLGAYGFSKSTSEKPMPVESVELVTANVSAKRATVVKTVCESTVYARNLVNENANVIIPEQLAREARHIARGHREMSCTVLTEREIRKQGLGLLDAVGQGSPFPPRLILLDYRGNPGGKKKTAIVGKGITFDSGGQNLKPSGHIETMRQDMAGAAAVLGTMRSIAVLKPKINVVAVVAAAHNAIGKGAYFPGDVYRSYSGKTVEITNTDAEGRLVLADAISYVQKNHKPAEVIDLATLTGAILVALGDTLAGLFSNDERLAEALTVAGRKTGELVWRLPLFDEHGEAMKSDIADLRNTSKLPKGHAGSITGAAFLKEFVKDIPWAHLDIAGTAWNDREPRGEVPRFGTGFGVRLLLEYLGV